VYSLSCAWLAGIAVARLPRLRGADFLGVYVAILGVVAGLSVLALDPEGVTSASLGGLALALSVGAGAGVAAVWAEAILVRAARPRSRRPGGARRSAGRPGRTAGAPSPTVPDARLGIGGRQARRGRDLGLLLAVAALEEILFRGVLLDLALSLPAPGLAVAAIAGLTLAFALTHVTFGWVAVLAKLPLSALATAAALATGTVAGAIAAHAVVNFWAWRA